MDAELLDKIINIITVYVPQVITVASIITAVTPTKKDDAILNQILRIINVFALNIGKAKPSE